MQVAKLDIIVSRSFLPVFQAVTPSRDVRAQFYSRMGLVATAAAQPSQSIKEEPVAHPSCSSSAEDEESSKERAKHGSDKESSSTKTEQETDDRLTVDCPGTDFPFFARYPSVIHLCCLGCAI